MSDDEKLDSAPGGSKLHVDEHQSDSDTENPAAGEGDLDTSSDPYLPNTVTLSKHSDLSIRVTDNSNITSRPRPIIRRNPDNPNMAGRTRKQWDLGKNETINSFESWKGHLLYTLNMDTNFAPFLMSGKTWEKKDGITL